MQTIVFTNGCFDVLHAGHLRLLKFAREQGDELIVGLNSDSSVRRLKGERRPINCCEERVALLKELRCVDKVLVFDEDTPERLIRYLRPHVLVKGPEAKKAYIPGSDFILLNGGKVIVPDWQVKISSTMILERLCDV